VDGVGRPVNTLPARSWHEIPVERTTTMKKNIKVTTTVKAGRRGDAG